MLCSVLLEIWTKNAFSSQVNCQKVWYKESCFFAVCKKAYKLEKKTCPPPSTTQVKNHKLISPSPFWQLVKMYWTIFMLCISAKKNQKKTIENNTPPPPADKTKSKKRLIYAVHFAILTKKHVFSLCFFKLAKMYSSIFKLYILTVCKTAKKPENNPAPPPSTWKSISRRWYPQMLLVKLSWSKILIFAFHLIILTKKTW